MTSPTSLTLLGATGLTGHAALLSLLQSPSHAFNIRTVTRKPLSTPAQSTNGQTTYQNSTYGDLFAAALEKVAESGGTVVSCLGTTRAKAGGVVNQRVVDVDLGLALARRAREDGAEHVIVVSSAGTSPSYGLPYSKMKNDLEEGLKALQFKSTVILKPGMLLGPREQYHSSAEQFAQQAFRFLRSWGAPVGGMCVDATDVGACIAHYAENKADGVVYVSNAEIVQVATGWRSHNDLA